MILTDDEIWDMAANCLDSTAGRLQFARAIEAAVLAKLREQEPVAWMNDVGNTITWDKLYPDMIPLYTHPAPEAKREPGLRADPFTYVIQHINSNPYSMTKAECITHIKNLRDLYNGVQHMSDCAVHNEPAYPSGECDCGVTRPTPELRQEPVAWHEPGAFGNVTTHKKWAMENGWLPLFAHATIKAAEG